MKFHPSKAKDLVVTRARTRFIHPPSQPFIEGAERERDRERQRERQRQRQRQRESVTTLKVLGVQGLF